MEYHITNKTDINEGNIVSISIPLEMVDKNALFTMAKDMPPFVVPFTYRYVNDKIEINYMVSRKSMLRYHVGTKSVEEFCRLFHNLLQPLQNCSDWFMDPFSFVLKYENLYYDSNQNQIFYLYIPSVAACSDAEELQQLAKQVERDFPVTDDAFRVKILEILTREFRIRDVLDVINSATTQNRINPEKIEPQLEKSVDEKKNHISVPNGSAVGKENDDIDDLEICFPQQEQPGKKGKKSGFLGGLFGRREKKEAAKKPNRHLYSAADEKPASNGKEFLSGNEDISEWFDSEKDANTVVKPKNGVKKARLVCIGDPALPKIIEIKMNSSNLFRIGRFDVKLGRKQSEFEFHEDTLEVSRHHAAIEWKNGKYYITDIGSQEGTILDDKHLPLNVAVELKNGSNVSFGNAGADYRFEC